MERRKQLQANLRQPSDALLEWEAVAQWLRNDAVIGELQRVLACEADAYLEWAAYACTSVWPPVQAAQILLAYPPAELFQVIKALHCHLPRSYPIELHIQKRSMEPTGPEDKQARPRTAIFTIFFPFMCNAMNLGPSCGTPSESEYVFSCAAGVPCAGACCAGVSGGHALSRRAWPHARQLPWEYVRSAAPPSFGDLCIPCIHVGAVSACWACAACLAQRPCRTFHQGKLMHVVKGEAC